MNISAIELKQYLLPIAEDIRTRLRSTGLPPLLVARYDTALEILGNLFIFLDKAIKQGAIDMKTLKDSVTVQVVKMSEIEGRHYKSEVEEKIKNWVNELQGLIKEAEKARNYNPETDKPALLIDPKEIKAAHLNTKVGIMRKEKTIPDNIRVVQRKSGELCYLIELERETSRR